MGLFWGWISYLKSAAILLTFLLFDVVGLSNGILCILVAQGVTKLQNGYWCGLGKQYSRTFNDFYQFCSPLSHKEAQYLTWIAGHLVKSVAPFLRYVVYFHSDPVLIIGSKMSKMKSTLFFSSKMSFSENLRCLNLPLYVGAVSQKRLLS